ncbi:MAG: hypothetical protein LBB62_04385 [Proteiniphilum sp.]|jgi:hypothetical protein|nr:hypothetical protein [Proteiniphilum sp.]
MKITKQYGGGALLKELGSANDLMMWRKVGRIEYINFVPSGTTLIHINAHELRTTTYPRGNPLLLALQVCFCGTKEGIDEYLFTCVVLCGGTIDNVFTA